MRAVPPGPRLVLTHAGFVAVVRAVVQRVLAGRVDGGDDLIAVHDVTAALGVLHQLARGGHLQVLGAPEEHGPHTRSVFGFDFLISRNNIFV